MKTRKPPNSARLLNRWVDAYAREHDLPPVRVRNWVSFMVLGGALERAGFDGAESRFTIKGGVALEMRFRHLARATRDLDLIFDGESDPVAALRATLASPYQGFGFRLKDGGITMPNGAQRLDISLAYASKPWGSVQVDVAPHEGSGTEVEMVDAISLASFGLEGPSALRCLSLPYHIAQKIHAVTLPPAAGRRNERFRDLVDLLLLKPLITDFEVVRRACDNVFRHRQTHAWPPVLSVPEHWVGPFEQMAVSHGLEITDVHQAAIEVRQLISALDQTAQWDAELDSPRGLRATAGYYVVLPDHSLEWIPVLEDEAVFVPSSEAPGAQKAWQDDSSGFAIIGVGLLLRHRKPRYAQRVRPQSVELPGDRVRRKPRVRPVKNSLYCVAITPA